MSSLLQMCENKTVNLLSLFPELEEFGTKYANEHLQNKTEMRTVGNDLGKNFFSVLLYFLTRHTVFLSASLLMATYKKHLIFTR